MDSTIGVRVGSDAIVAVELGALVAVADGLGVAVAVGLMTAVGGWKTTASGGMVGADAPETRGAVPVGAAVQRLAVGIGVGCPLARARSAAVAVTPGVCVGGAVGTGVLVEVGALVASGGAVMVGVSETSSLSASPAVLGALIALLAVPPSLTVINGMSTYMIAAARKMTSSAAAIASSDGVT
jgi:hypothetical protein